MALRLRERANTVRRLLPSRGRLRLVFVALVIMLLLPIGATYVSTSEVRADEDQMANKNVAPRDGVTVATSDVYGGGYIIAFAPNGSAIYHNDTYPYYHDVDPSAAGDRTVLYVATENVGKEECHAETRCRRTVVERLNLTTGEVTRVWSSLRPRRGGSNAIHDVDYIGNGRLLVAEIADPDGVYIVNTTTGTIEWNWRAQQNYSTSSGGKYPTDWTHINDVELLPDGRIMVSVRNQDQAIFIDRDSGEVIEENRTLGADDNHSTLYEQHNPDFIPEANGGPAVLVADSENNRVVEYQRRGDTWNQSWIWQDRKLEWPRDADRLPNGNTLVTDTHGNRLVEVNRQGEVVWKASLPGPYEAERLDTGDESANSSSAAALGLQSVNFGRGTLQDVQQQNQSPVERFVYGVVSLVPPLLLHGLLFMFPAWMTPLSALAFVALLATLLVWAATELWWSSYSVAFARPVRFERG